MTSTASTFAATTQGAALFRPNTFIDVFFSNHGPRAKIVRDCLVVGVTPLILALLGRFVIPLPFSLVPITGQTFGVLVLGAVLGWQRAILGLGLFLLSGGLGVPFFSGGGSGWAHLFGPSGGYLVGFMAAAALMGWMSERYRMDRQFARAWTLFFVGHTVIFTFGVLWLSLWVGFDQAVLTGFVPFVPGEIIKTTFAAAATKMAWSASKINPK